MADNVIVLGAATSLTEQFRVASDKITYSGDANVDCQLTRPVHVTGAEGSKTAVDLSDATGLHTHHQPAISGGCLTYHVVSAASTNAVNIKSSAGQIYGIDVFNNSASYPVFVKFHNTAGTPTPGAGVVRAVGVQAGTGRRLECPAGLEFTTGIGISIVKGITNADAVAVALSDCVVDVDYK